MLFVFLLTFRWNLYQQKSRALKDLSPSSSCILFQDSKSLKVLQELREKFVILKPDKGKGIVLIDHGDYVNSMQRIFGDASKF